MEGHVVDPLLGLVLDDVEQALLGQVLDLLDLLDRLVHRHGADGHGAGGDDGPADGVDVAAGGEVHHGVGAEVDGHPELGQLVVDVGGDGRVADVGVDLANGLDADAHRLEPLLEVLAVGGDHHPPPGDLGADRLGVELLARGDEIHLGRDPTEPSLFDLRHGANDLRRAISIPIRFLSNLRRPRTNRPIEPRDLS